MATTQLASRAPVLTEPTGAPRTKRDVYVAMSGLLIAMLLAMLDNLIVGTAMPTIVGELGGLAHLSWVVTAYTLATAASTPVWAKLGDLFGRRGVFMASIAVFLVGSALAGQSHNMAELIAFRGLQGLGAGGLMVGAMAIIGDLVPPRERGRYQGMMAAVMPLAFIGGPLLGGYLTDHLSWRWAFYVNLPLGALALVVTALTMRLPPRRGGQVSIDWWGAGLLGTGITALSLLASWGGSQYAWGSWQILALAVLALVAGAMFVVVERRLESSNGEPILSLSLFANRNFAATIAMTFLVGFAMFGAVTFLPQFQQNVQSASATNSGLLLLPLMGGMLVTSLAGGQFITRTGRYKGLLVAGSVVMAGGLGLLATMTVSTSRFTTSMYMVVLGVGMGMLMQTTMLVIQNSVEQRDLGAASGAATLFRTLGGSLGVSLLGTLFTERLTTSLRGSTAGAATNGLNASSQITPAMLGRLPAPVRSIFQHAIVSGIEQVFVWGAAIALLGLIAALIIEEVPLRSDAHDTTDPAADSGQERGVDPMTTQQSHADIPDAGTADGGVPTRQRQFLGATADSGRRAVQRFMWADVRRRSHERAASTWQRIGVAFGVVAALAASLAAVTYVASWGWAAIALSILVALVVPLAAALRCADRAAEHRHAGATLAATAAEFDRYIQRQLGPSTWRHDPADVDDLISVLDALEDALGQTDWARLPRTAPRRRDIAATAAHGEYLLSCLQIANLPLPPPATWV